MEYETDPTLPEQLRYILLAFLQVSNLLMHLLYLLLVLLEDGQWLLWPWWLGLHWFNLHADLPINLIWYNIRIRGMSIISY